MHATEIVKSCGRESPMRSACHRYPSVPVVSTPIAQGSLALATVAYPMSSMIHASVHERAQSSGSLLTNGAGQTDAPGPLRAASPVRRLVPIASLVPTTRAFPTALQPTCRANAMVPAQVRCFSTPPLADLRAMPQHGTEIPVQAEHSSPVSLAAEGLVPQREAETTPRPVMDDEMQSCCSQNVVGTGSGPPMTGEAELPWQSRLTSDYPPAEVVDVWTPTKPNERVDNKPSRWSHSRENRAESLGLTSDEYPPAEVVDAWATLGPRAPTEPKERMDNKLGRRTHSREKSNRSRVALNDNKCTKDGAPRRSTRPPIDRTSRGARGYNRGGIWRV